MPIRRIIAATITAIAAGGLSFGFVSATTAHKPAHVYETSHVYDGKSPAIYGDVTLTSHVYDGKAPSHVYDG